MDKVEGLVRSLALNIVSDSTRISKSKSDRRATLILSEGHYSLASNPGRLHPSNLDRKRKSPLYCTTFIKTSLDKKIIEKMRSFGGDW
ncbi:hypothetical protein RhiirC2_798424 [Rhizophagus irregularis]|uniref:Uncharacterized protein n=1 Tax=Rhizophagus irregularis TaxID=588596 RepID=A0A2N1M6H1_9GLOM|nr:hypothetical protein RhiirC2_798424 [Rhizophagus irregularis]